MDRGAPGVDNVTGWGEVRFRHAHLGAAAPALRAPRTVPAVRHPLGPGRAGGKVRAGNVVKAALGQGGIPASGVSAVVVNVTANDTGTNGFLQVYPHAWGTIGGSSNLNVDRPAQTVAGLTVVPVGPTGASPSTTSPART